MISTVQQQCFRDNYDDDDADADDGEGNDNDDGSLVNALHGGVCAPQVHRVHHPQVQILAAGKHVDR